ncbi:PP2C family serine/threonine-protein phosphatase [Pseudomonas sp. Q12-87]|uniref:PP2C family protein-serine/threonine phosphatase n=1 Tax=Pseudomonas sp. Q12-87 TaxID=177989 RepID=UPI000B0DEE37|nr:PP2C family serine/threonine-protein phosphatase [Pseudomonas sp. Q12-87]
MRVESYTSFDRLKAWFLRKTPLGGVRRLSAIAGAIASDIGTSREENQDRAAIMRVTDFSGETYTLVAVSDGMGGMQSGGICAATTLAAFFTSFMVRSREGIRFDEGIIESALDANRAVYDLYGGRGGATLSALLINASGNCIWLNVGDSRIYGVRDSGILQFTTDDTISGQLGDKFGGLKNRSELLQFVGMGEELEPHYSLFGFSDANHFLVTTDGVHYLDEKILQDIALNAPDAGACLKRLVDVSKWCGGKDNCSAVMFAMSESLFFQDEFAGRGVCEVWDSFGDLQFFFEEKHFEKKYARVGESEVKDVKEGKSKSRAKTKPKNLSVGKKALPSSWDKVLKERYVDIEADADYRESKNNPEKNIEKTPPQLKISFPGKD